MCPSLCESIRIPPQSPHAQTQLPSPLSVMKEEGPALVVSYVQSSQPPNISIDHPMKTHIRGVHNSLQSQAIWREIYFLFYEHQLTSI